LDGTGATFLEAPFLQSGESIPMRTLGPVLIGVVLLSAAIGNPDRTRIPTVSTETLTFGEVRRGFEVAAAAARGHSPETLLVDRPAGAGEGTTSGVFVVADDGVTLVRMPVRFGRASTSLIEIAGAVAPGDRIVVSDMRAWDAFDRVRLK
jgi:hypothetical protein